MWEKLRGIRRALERKQQPKGLAALLQTLPEDRKPVDVTPQPADSPGVSWLKALLRGDAPEARREAAPASDGGLIH